MDLAKIIIDIGIFIATAGAAAVAWAQAKSAIRASDEARDAEKAAIKARQDASDALFRANEIVSVSHRGPFAYALFELSTAIMAARTTGGSEERVKEIMNERIRDLTEKAFLAGDVPTNPLTQWVTAYSRKVYIGEPFDPDVWAQSGAFVLERIRLWMRDPDEAVALIGRDPGIDVSPGG